MKKHTLNILSLFLLFQTNLSANIYEDGDTNDTSRWTVIRGDRTKISNIQDSKNVNNRVIHVASLSNRYSLNINYSSIPMKQKLSFDILQPTGDYALYLYLTTENGQRMINYTNRQTEGTAILLNNSTSVGIANKITIREWSHVTLDFVHDLANVDMNNTILSVDSLVIRGGFSIDNIQLIEETSSSSPLLAFPTAEGSGAYTKGGRGGALLEVTNLNATGTGSLREACESNGSRMVVFRVGGTIDLGGDDIIITNDNISILGQTAPGDGIQIKNGGLVINASEVVMRYLRLRPGPAHTQVDALTIKSPDRHHRKKNIIMDHISAFWAVDENIDAGAFNDNITVQWSIIAEGLHESIHEEGKHSRGIMITEESRNITLHHNLIYRNYKRNPLVQSSDADVVNNVIVNKQYQVFIQPFKGKVQANFVGNYFRSYAHVRPPIRVYDYGRGYDGASGLFYKDNYDAHFRANSSDSEYNIRILHQRADTDTHVQDKTERYPFKEVNTEPVHDAYISVLAEAGANYPHRDSADSRVVNRVLSGNAPNTFVHEPSDVGGWPELSIVGIPPLDEDHDGMADEWEIAHGLNANNPLDGNEKTLSIIGYTNLEVYLNDFNF